MPRIQNIMPGRAVGQLPVERIIQTGRRTGPKTFPERLDHFVVSHTSPAGDAAGNREIDKELCETLLEEQRRFAPELPADKLRAIQAFLAPASGDGRDISSAFGSEYRCRTEDRTVICSGNGVTADWMRQAEYDDKDQFVRFRPPPSCLSVSEDPDAHEPFAQVLCRGKKCPFYGRTTPDGKKQVFPRCKSEWELRVQIAARGSVFGVARLQSSSIVGLDETEGVIQMLEDMVGREAIPSFSSVPLELRLKNITTQHSKNGAWTAYLYARGDALALIEATERAYANGRQLGSAPRVAGQLAAATRADAPLVPYASSSDLADAEVIPEEEYDDHEETAEVDDASEAVPVSSAAEGAREAPASAGTGAAATAPAEDGEERADRWGSLAALAADLAGDEAVARAALKSVIHEAGAIGLPAWSKDDGPHWMMSEQEYGKAEEAIEDAVAYQARKAAQAAAEEAAA
jgi:hypothetical protein